MALQFPTIDPVAISLGPIQIHWYGLMYLFGLAAAYGLGFYRAQRSQGLWSKDDVSDLLFYTFVGVLVGGRVGYVLFYHFDYFLADPSYLLRIWEGGMSFHGGLLGVLAGIWWYGKKTQRGFWAVADFGAPLVPLGLAFGRFGNFINGELWGRTTDVPWGMVFPGAGALPRHPSQLYQFALEGLALFIILWWFSSKPRPKAAVSGLFMLGYGVFRFIAEFFREPDAHLGFISSGLSMGQLLSTPMIVLGLVILVMSYRQAAKR